MTPLCWGWDPPLSLTMFPFVVGISAVFWRHVICLVAQIHSQRGICQDESHLDSATSDVERVWRRLWALGVSADPVMS